MAMETHDPEKATSPNVRRAPNCTNILYTVNSTADDQQLSKQVRSRVECVATVERIKVYHVGSLCKGGRKKGYRMNQVVDARCHPHLTSIAKRSKHKCISSPQKHT